MKLFNLSYEDIIIQPLLYPDILGNGTSISLMDQGSTFV